MIDHDAIFKQLLTAFFVEFLDLFAPEVLALLDRSSLTFLDKESFGDLVDIYLPLNTRQERELEQEIQAVRPEERRPIMEMLTSWEIKGEIKGRVEGQRDIVIRQLQRKLGPLPEELLARVEVLSSEQVADLSEGLRCRG